MKGAASVNLQHLRWAIESRAKIQKCALALLELFEAYGNRWKTKKFSRAAQDLSSVAFSLWRAAFLAEKTSKREAVFEQGRDFLRKVVEDNTISYPQDKTAREWTFNYYTRNARASLEVLASNWNEVKAYKGKKRTPTERWDYCHDLLSQAVEQFGQTLLKQRTESDRIQKKKARRDQRRLQRRKVRQLVLADRNRSQSSIQVRSV